MSYYYTDQSRETEPNALPDVEVLLISANDSDFIDARMESAIDDGGDPMATIEYVGHWYAHGSPGCLWDSDPSGPFDTEAEALSAAREAAGFCEHGISDEGVCEECPAPELWAWRVRGRAGYFSYDGMVSSILKASCWADKASAYRADTPVNGYPTRLPDADARRWGHTE
jgi:hypothetical protein